MSIDPIIKDHQLWIGFVQPDGLVVSPHALKNAQAVPSRNVTFQQEFSRRHAIPDCDGNLRLMNFPYFTCDSGDWPMLAALHLLLPRDRLFIGPENQRLPAILEASRRYQNEVSIRLAGQVLRALNELVRGFQEADRAAHGAILAEALRHDPNHIYGGMLTTLMRMVFVLYAEDRSLMGSDEH